MEDKHQLNSAVRIMFQELKHGLQLPGARTLPEYERDTNNKKKELQSQCSGNTLLIHNIQLSWTKVS